MGDGEKEIEVLSLKGHRDYRHLFQNTEFTWDCPRTDRESPLLDMEETQRGKQADGGAMELMASPTHPVHLFEKQPYLDTDSSSSSLSSTHEALSAAAYANFVHIDASEKESVKPSPVAILLLTSAGNFNNKFSLNLSSHAEAVPLLRRERGFKCSRSSELLMAITSSVQDAVQEHGPSGMSTLPILSDDDEEAPKQGQVCDNELHDQLRVAICDHPLYPEMVLAHIGILKIGAPRELHVKLDEVTKKFQRFYEGGHYTSKLGQDPELDHFMKSYVVMLTSFREDLEEPFNKFMQFTDKTTKELEDLCGHYVETKPEEEDNYGFDIGPREGAQDYSAVEYSENNILPGEDQSNVMQCPTDIDDSIVVDPDASEEELKTVLTRKYGRHIGALKAEFNRVRKKGKLPDAARRILKDWFNLHAHWPYPSEMEKAYLQRLCDLTLKQINNWFINERKRHWNSEERSMYPNPKFNDDDAAGEGTGHLEH